MFQVIQSICSRVPSALPSLQKEKKKPDVFHFNLELPRWGSLWVHFFASSEEPPFTHTFGAIERLLSTLSFDFKADVVLSGWPGPDETQGL